METLQGGENIDIQDSTRRTEPDAISQPVESSLSIFSQPLRVSTFKEKPLEASKWVHVQCLLETDELRSLFQSLGDFLLFQCGSVTPRRQTNSSIAEFLEHYSTYINLLKNGQTPTIASLQPWFSMVMTRTSDAVFSIPVGESQQIIRVAKPVIQLQAGTIDYSPVDKKFRSMVFGCDNISWGIQFSYPHLYQDPLTRNVETIRNTPEYPNTELFHLLQKWMRQHTIPTPLIAEEKLINIPIRIGKLCLTWINKHAQLISKDIYIKE